jgi:iduronate 2-sulfatase
MRTTFYAFFILLLFQSALNAQKPNILLIVSDDLNSRIGPFMNVDKHTPHLDRLANEGVRFSTRLLPVPDLRAFACFVYERALS